MSGLAFWVVQLNLYGQVKLIQSYAQGRTCLETHVHSFSEITPQYTASGVLYLESLTSVSNVKSTSFYGLDDILECLNH